MSKTSTSTMGIVEEGAVAVYERVDSLVEHMSDSARVERWSKLSSVRVLNTVHWPQDLFDSVEHDAIPRFLALMICREAAVVGRMPILRRDDEIKVPLQFVGERDDFITVWHGQRATGQKVILKIDNDQYVHWLEVISKSRRL